MLLPFFFACPVNKIKMKGERTVKTKQNFGGIRGELIGFATGLLSCFCLTGLVSKLLVTEAVSEDRIEIAILAILALTGAAACLSAIKLSNRGQYRAAGITCGMLLLFMLFGCFMVEGECRNILANVMCVVLGSGFSCILCMKKRTKYGKRKRRNR